jgi:excisionase family DNA binding protein
VQHGRTDAEVIPKRGAALGLRVSEVAQRLGVSPGTVRRWSDDGYLVCYRTPGGQRRYSDKALRTFMARMAAHDFESEQ